MSYCSLEEAWGPSSICSRVTNKSGKKNNISYKIANEQDCSENNFMYNDLDNEDNYSLLPQKYNSNNLILDYNNNNTTNNNLSLDKPVELNEKLNDELDVKPHDLNYSHYSNFNELNNDDNIANEDMEENNNKDIEEDIEKDIEKELDEDSSELKHFNNKINIEGFTNNTNTIFNPTELGGGFSGISPKPIVLVERGNQRGMSRMTLRRAGYQDVNSFIANNPGYNTNYIIQGGQAVKNKAFLKQDSSDRTRRLKLKAENLTYNDLTFGGDKNNGSYTARSRARY